MKQDFPGNIQFIFHHPSSFHRLSSLLHQSVICGVSFAHQHGRIFTTQAQPPLPFHVVTRRSAIRSRKDGGNYC